MDFAFSAHYYVTSYLCDEISNISFFGNSDGYIKLGIFDSSDLHWDVNNEIYVGLPVNELYGNKSKLYVISLVENGMSFIKAKPTE